MRRKRAQRAAPPKPRVRRERPERRAVEKRAPLPVDRPVPVEESVEETGEDGASLDGFK